MGRNSTPSRFKRELAQRVKAARLRSGSENKDLKVFAKKLGVDWERYKKWESGRTPIQPEYVQKFYDLTGADANYLFETEPRVASHKTG